jgi:metal-responsive CopG/Arc/MetJ family transcriptional regulator
MPRPRTYGKGVETVKTSVELPEDLWRAAKILAMDEKKNLQEVIADALRNHLKAKKGGKKDER